MANDATNAGVDLSTSTDTLPAHVATGEAEAESPIGSRNSSTGPKMSECKFKVGDVVVFDQTPGMVGVVSEVTEINFVSVEYDGGTRHVSLKVFPNAIRHATAQEAFLAWNKGNPHVTFSKYEEIKKREQQEEQKKQQGAKDVVITAASVLGPVPSLQMDMPKEPALAVDMFNRVVVRCVPPTYPRTYFECWSVGGVQPYPRRRRDLLMVGDKFSWVGKETGTVREIDWSDNLVLFRDTDDYGYMRSMLGGISVTEQDGKLVPPSQDYQNWNKTVSGYPAWARDIKCDRLISVPKECTIYMPDGTKKTIEASDPIASELSNVEPGPWEEKEAAHEFKVGDRVTCNWDTSWHGTVREAASGRYCVFWDRWRCGFWYRPEELDILLEPSGKAAEDTPLSEATQAWIRNWVDAAKAKKTMTILSAITALQPPATSEESPPAVVGEQPPRKEISMLKTLAFVGKIGLYASAAFGVAAFGTISLYASGYAPEWLNDTLINTYLRYTEYQDRVFGSIGGLAAAGPLLYGARRLGVSAWQHVTAAFTTALADAVAKGIEDGTAPKK